MDKNLIEKICKKCGEKKNIDNFHKHPNTDDGYRNECKKCRGNGRKVEYAVKNKKGNELDILKEKLKNFMSEYHEKVIKCDDPYELEKIQQGYTAFMEAYKNKLFDIMCPKYCVIPHDDFNPENPVFTIEARFQAYFIDKKIIVEPEDVNIKKLPRGWRIDFPKNIRITKEEISKLIEFIKKNH